MSINTKIAPLGSNAGLGEEPDKNGNFSFTKTDDENTNLEIARLHPSLRNAAANFIKNAKDHTNVYVIKIVTGVRTLKTHNSLKKNNTLSHDYKDSHHLTGTAFRIEIVSIDGTNKTKYLQETNGSVTSTNEAHWKEIGKLAEAQGFHWGGNGGDSLFQKYNDVNYGTGWNKNYFEFRDCGQRKGAKKYWSREKDADGWFELGCPPQ
tara:strand:- start:999 stop:1619 length:621 start_codon:yes stop_codon:yes gene_type:complete